MAGAMGTLHTPRRKVGVGKGLGIDGGAGEAVGAVGSVGGGGEMDGSGSAQWGGGARRASRAIAPSAVRPVDTCGDSSARIVFYVSPRPFCLYLCSP